MVQGHRLEEAGGEGISGAVYPRDGFGELLGGEDAIDRILGQ